MTRRLRTLCVVAILVGGAVALIASTQTWLDVTLVDRGPAPLPVAGASAMALLAPLSLAALALGLALSIVGRVLRYMFGVLAVAIGGVLAVGALRVIVALPVESFSAPVTETTGLSGPETIAALVAGITVTPWPFLTVAAAVVIAAGGGVVLATAHRWPGSGRRYRTDAASDGVGTPAASRPHDAIDSWDDLSRGDDPTR